MAGVRDSDLVIQTGFPAGLDNVSPEQSLPRDEGGNPVAARALVNLDVIDGKPRTRAGYARLAEGRWHSPGKLTGRALFAVKDGDLVQLDSNGNVLQTIRAGVGERRISYAEVNGDLLWSNGQAFRRITGDTLADLPGWIEAPGAPDVAAHADGGLTAGNYAVAMTWLDAAGRESGAWGVVDATVGLGQGIRVFNIPPAPEYAVRARIYVSTANGSELYAAKDISPLATNVLVTAADVREAGKALETLWHASFPPCDLLRHQNGRLLGVKGNLLVWSPPLRQGLHHSDDYMRCGAEITLMEPLEGAGVWLADHARTYWLQGTSPREWRRIGKHDKPAVRGTSIVVPGTVVGVDTSAPVAFWLAADGVFCVGMPDGNLIRLKEGQLALPYGEEGAILFREHAGLRQLVATYMSRGANGMAMTDRASATVTRY